MLKDLHEFRLRGSLLELAVALLIGIALAAVVRSLVDNIVMPIIGPFFGTPSFSALTHTINVSIFSQGPILMGLLVFGFITGVVFCCVVTPTAAVLKRAAQAKGDEPDVTEESLADIERLLEEHNGLAAQAAGVVGAALV